ncbi:MAG: IS630 family transposase [Gammaproteobacteria bacterium]|nr:IS630 family transposase [Gammaproteobacteria bacterium]
MCETYHEASALIEQDVHVVSTDEKTGIQATERKYSGKPTIPGKIERIEGEYIRHGTLCLIASFHVVSGVIIASKIGPTRTEDDFAEHIRCTIDTDPCASWIFIADQLNTHKSEALVRLVTERCGINDNLGIKGKSGLLKSMASRQSFLEDTSHRIRFVYTPRHCSWLNQIEIWFSILARRFLKGASFRSTEELHKRLEKFVRYFNSVLAKPFKWTYTGRPLEAGVR